MPIRFALLGLLEVLIYAAMQHVRFKLKNRRWRHTVRYFTWQFNSHIMRIKCYCSAAFFLNIENYHSYCEKFL
jgi:hypothetical protein